MIYSSHREGSIAALTAELKCCPAEINLRGMDAWRSLGKLAEFPGTLVLDDARPLTEAYTSDEITPESLHKSEPGLSNQAAAKGARLYKQEGTLVASDFDKLDPC